MWYRVFTRYPNEIVISHLRCFLGWEVRVIKKVNVSLYENICWLFVLFVVVVGIFLVIFRGYDWNLVWLNTSILAFCAVLIFAAIAKRGIDTQLENGEQAVRMIHRTFLTQEDVDQKLHQLWDIANQSASRPVQISGIANAATSVLESRIATISAQLELFKEAREVAKFAGFRVHRNDDEYGKTPPYFT